MKPNYSWNLRPVPPPPPGAPPSSYVDAGWTATAFARDGWGEVIAPWHPAARFWDLPGAIMAASARSYALSTFEIAQRLLRKVKEGAQVARRENDPFSIVSVSDGWPHLFGAACAELGPFWTFDLLREEGL